MVRERHTHTDKEIDKQIDRDTGYRVSCEKLYEN